MENFLNWFQLAEFFPLVVLIFLLNFVGGQIVPPKGDPRKGARVAFVVSVAAYGLMALATWGIPDVTETMLILIRAILAGGMAYGLGLIGLSLALVLQESLLSLKTLLPVTKTPVPPPVEPIAPPVIVEPAPPPPTLDERAELARQRYQHRLELIESANLGSLEDTAAKEKAKQVYLREIDGIIA